MIAALVKGSFAILLLVAMFGWLFLPEHRDPNRS